MDRISALRNVEEALREFEAGEADLAATERRVVTVLRTYATEFEGEEGRDLAAYRARGDPPADGTVVVAATPAEARDRIRDLLATGAATGEDGENGDGENGDGEDGNDADGTPAFDVEPL